MKMTEVLPRCPFHSTTYCKGDKARCYADNFQRCQDYGQAQEKYQLILRSLRRNLANEVWDNGENSGLFKIGWEGYA